MLLLYRIAFFLYFPSGLISRERAGKKKGNSNTVENKTSRRKKNKKMDGISQRRRRRRTRDYCLHSNWECNITKGGGVNRCVLFFLADV
jgi:hypothetical protein